jgi:deoxycytidylate deaminase
MLIVYINGEQIMHNVKYPYLPAGRTIKYVPAGNEYMAAAHQVARDESLDDNVPTGSVIVKAGHIIGAGANGSTYHKDHPCRRVELGIPTGQGYELCEGCHPKNHSEAKAIAATQADGQDPAGADLYLWGHWWCCEPCWDKMISAGIKDVYLMEGSEELFNKKRASQPKAEHAA